MYRWRRTNKFKDYIVEMFKHYTIIIIMMIFILFGISILFNFRTTIVKTNRLYNKSIGNFIEREFNNFRENIDNLVEEEAILNTLNMDGKVWESNILLYEYVNRQKIKSSFVLLDMDNNIITTNLYRENQRILSTSSMLVDITQRIRDNPDMIYADLNSIKYDHKQNSPFLFAKAVKDDGEIIGYLIFFLKEESFKLYTRGKQVDIVILTDRYENVLFTTSNLTLNSMGKINIGNRNKNTTMFNEQPYYVISDRVQNGDIHVVTMTSIDKYKQFLIIGVLFSLGISFLIIVLVTILSPKIIERNLRSLDSLVYGVGQLKEGNIDYRIESRTFDEFQIIYDEFNNMASRIQTLIEHNNEIAERKRVMEIRHLENQFNPHFVYNVMEMLRYEILLDPKLASDILVSFAKLMRYTTSYGSVEVPLGVDISYIESYLKLQKMRFNKRLNYNIVVEDSFKDYKVPKLILQPIVENSIKHGIENTKNLNIDVIVREVNRDIEIVVEDNGQGIKEDKLIYLRELLRDDTAMPEHIGLYNAHRIIRLLYGGSYGLTIHSKYGVGTKIILRMPLIGDERDV
ncbi:sensor histidine kinase [Tissierellaceae bacterium HCP3S3_D8]